jgi:hypothetical protein
MSAAPGKNTLFMLWCKHATTFTVEGQNEVAQKH